LCVALTEAGCGTDGIRVVDEARPDEGHRLEPAVRMSGETRNGGAVIHVPSGRVAEVLAERPPVERRIGAEVVVAFGVGVDVVCDEEERIDGLPGRAQPEDLAYGRGTCGSHIGFNYPSARFVPASGPASGRGATSSSDSTRDPAAKRTTCSPRRICAG